MASITTWTRLETRQRTDSLDVGLAARVHDPLWLLTRQMQLAELRGHDSGSPVRVSVRAAVGRLDRFLAGAPGDDAADRSRPYDDASVPLEAVVAAEPMTARSAPRLAVEAGAHFVRMLKAAGLDRYRTEFVTAFQHHPPADAELDPVGARFADFVASRVPDGLGLREALEEAPAGTLPDEVTIAPADVAAVLQVSTRWLEWFGPVVTSPDDGDAWVPDRLEHSFAVATVVNGSERVLVSRKYSSGRLDWHDFDVAAGPFLGSEARSELVVRTVLPAPVTFPGMPAPRWWAFEDATIDLGAVDAGADDVARMLMVGFAVDYGNDWFVVPVELPVGSLTTITALEVTDTFGVRTRIRSAADVAVDADAARWRMFELTGDDQIAEELLFLPPALAGTTDGPVRERVTIARDELANLAWAIEEVVESATGRGRLRGEEPRPPGPARSVGGLVTYEVATSLAAHWHPLIPIADDSGAAMLERRELSAPTGTLLRNEFRIFEEELPGEGLGIERTFQVARWIQGRTALWSTRRRTAGRGPMSSGLRFGSSR